MEHVKNPAAPNEHPERGVFALISEDRIAAAEGTFFTWLGRIMLAAVLAGAAGIDDAPPLGLGAMLVTLYVAVRAGSRLGDIVAAVRLRIPDRTHLRRTPCGARDLTIAPTSFHRSNLRALASPAGILRETFVSGADRIRFRLAFHRVGSMDCRCALSRGAIHHLRFRCHILFG